MQQVVSAYQQLTADEDDDDHPQYQQYQQYEQEQQEQVYEEQCGDEGDDNAEGAAAGLLQLARAALMHLEGEIEEGAGSHQHKQEQMDDEVADNDGFEQQQEAGSEQHSNKHRPSVRHPGAGLFIKSEPVVRSNSEDSAHTAEDEEGSPMAEANLKLQLQQHKPGSIIMGKRTPAGMEQLLAGAAGTKRHRSMWEQVVPGSGAPVSTSFSRLSRPVLDVSEPQFAIPSTIAADASSPASPPLAVSARGISPAAAVGQQNDAQSQLLGLMMQAFLGAAAAEGTTSATALSPNHLAAVARVMALSGLAFGTQSLGVAAAGVAAPVAGQNGVADVLAAMTGHESAAGLPAAGTPVSAWSASSIEQQLRASMGQ